MKNNYLNKRLTCQQGKYFAVDKQNETKTHFIWCYKWCSL